MALSFPPGGTFFDTIKKSFADVPVDAARDNAIPTTEFLEAAEALMSMFDVVGSTALDFVKKDMSKNIEKVHERQLAFPGQSATLQALVTNEDKNKKGKAGDALLWLVRGLNLLGRALQDNIAKPQEEIAGSFGTSYAVTLRKHHGFAGKAAFNVGMMAIPYRKDFYKKLGDDTVKINDGLRKWIEALKAQVIILRHFQNDVTDDERTRRECQEAMVEAKRKGETTYYNKMTKKMEKVVDLKPEDCDWW